MTKKELQEIAKEEAQKTSLKWRLQSKPTLKDVTLMLEKDIIDKDEARQILFSEETKDEKVKALEEQIEFLKSVIEKMPYSSPQVVYQYITKYVPNYGWNSTPWGGTTVLVGANTVKTLASSSGIGASTLTTGTGTSGTTVGYMQTAKSND